MSLSRSSSGLPGLRRVGRRGSIVLASALLLAAPAARAATVPAAAKAPRVTPPSVPVDSVPALVETDPVAGEKDAADDMAIWVNPSNRAESLVIGTDKAADALEVYDLAGTRLQRIPDRNGSVNNVDLRYGFPLGGTSVDI